MSKEEAPSIFMHPDEVKKSNPYGPFPEKAPTGVDLMDTFPEFMTVLHAKLKAGAKEYGDVSLDRPLDELFGEISEELVDQAGWGFIGWFKCRYYQRLIRHLRDRISELEKDSC